MITIICGIFVSAMANIARKLIWQTHKPENIILRLHVGEMCKLLVAIPMLLLLLNISRIDPVWLLLSFIGMEFIQLVLSFVKLYTV